MSRATLEEKRVADTERRAAQAVDARIRMGMGGQRQVMKRGIEAARAAYAQLETALGIDAALQRLTTDQGGQIDATIHQTRCANYRTMRVLLPTLPPLPDETP